MPMRKPLFSKSLLLFIAALATSYSVLAQCGLSAFKSPAGNLTPNNAWQNVNVGSGTYAEFNVVPGNIYSFRYLGSSALSYTWDMTLSNSSAVIPYNNNLTPTLQPWTGGICPGVNRPQSTDWYSTFSGTIRVNTKAFNGACNDHVFGLGSATLQYKTCPAASDPGTGNNVWHVEAFATASLNIPQPLARYGYYVDNNLNYNTAAFWAPTSNPATASTWVGCSEIPNDVFTLRARRTGFPCNLYRLFLNNSDDEIQIFLNGAPLYSAGCCVGSSTPIGDPNGYVLGANDNIEIRSNGVCAGEVVNFIVQPQGLPAVNGGTIGGVPNNAVICEGTVPGLFTNVTPASGGASTFNNGGVISYDWEVSLDGGATYVPQGLNQPDWNLNTPVPAGGVYVIRRRAFDRCGNSAYSNSITVLGQPAPNASMSPTTQTVCPGAPAIITLNFTAGTSPFSFSFTDGVNTYNRTGKVNGDTIQVIPLTNTIYSFTSITDALGCNRTSGFLSGAQLITVPDITIASVNSTPVSCFGGNNGTLTINASGGQGTLEYSIDGGITYQGSNVFTGLSANTYNVVVRDGFGCVKVYGLVAVNQPADVSHTTVVTDASCANVFDGTISITASGGVPPYTYSLNGGPPQPGNVFSGVGAGTYTVYVLDSNNCLDTTSATINNTYIISVSVQGQTNVSCFGAADGSVTVQVNGGIPPYTYSINGITFQPSGTFTGLNSGTYIVTGRDSKGCTEFATVTISQPALVVATVDSILNATCNGSATGSIYITPSGGSGTYTYTWSNGATTQDLVNVTAGTYNVTVLDGNSCSAITGATISQPLALFVNLATFNNLLCNSDSTGSVDITANGGTPPYTYSWNNGAVTEDIVNLPASTYVVTVTDANACSASISQLVSEPAVITSSINGTNVSCFGAQDGAANLTVNGGTAPYFFQWSTFQATEDVTGLGGGLFYVIITDANGCEQRDSVQVSEPAPLTLSLTVTNVTCSNASDGAIDLTVTGGTAPYTYLWSTGATTEDVSGLNGGTVTVTVTDANSCTASAQAVIVNPTPINTSFVVKNTLCNGDSNGLIDLIPSGGTPPFTFAWSNGASTEDLNNLPANTYIVTITDANNCLRIDSATVTQPDFLYTSGFTKNVTCNGFADGCIDITPYGGTLPYDYIWSHGPNTEDVCGLTGGDYYVTITDVNGCQLTSLYVIDEPAVLDVTLSAVNVTCPGGTDGSVQATVTGGRTPYQYLWNNFASTSSMNGLTGGKYAVLVTDSSSCKVIDSIFITEPTAFSITGVVTNVNCGADTTGAIDVTVSGATAPYTYVWSHGPTVQDVSGLTAGQYAVTVTDANGCTSVGLFTVTQQVSLTTNLSVYNPVCNSGSNGFAAIQVGGGLAPYKFTWNTTPPQNGSIATNLSAGVYTCTVSDSLNCSVVVTATLVDPTPISIVVKGTEAKCYNTATGIVDVDATGGTPPYVYELNGVIQVSDTFFNVAPGNYIVAVRDANGCENTQTFIITSPSQVTVDLSAPQAVILAGMKTQLFAVASSSPSPIINYYWTPLDTAGLYDFSGCSNPANCPNPFVSPLFTTTFQVAAMNADSCFAYDTVTIIVENEPASFIPTAFTPNGDGLNDRFEFDILGAVEIEVSVFDRWGSRVYYNANQTNGLTGTDGWDGTKDGKKVPFDTYVWQMRVKDFRGIEMNKSGTVTVME